MNTKALLFVGAALVIATGAQAQSVVYDNGMVDLNGAGYGIADTQAVTNSFTFTSAQTVSGFTFGGIAISGRPITAISYGFSTTNDFAVTGLTALTAGPIISSTAYRGYDVRTYTAAIAPMMFKAGTYFFTLTNALGGDPGDINYAFWNENSGPSVAYQTDGVEVAKIPSEAFTLTGPAVPEPATWAMMVLGFGLVGLGLRRTVKVSFA